MGDFGYKCNKCGERVYYCDNEEEYFNESIPDNKKRVGEQFYCVEDGFGNNLHYHSKKCIVRQSIKKAKGKWGIVAYSVVLSKSNVELPPHELPDALDDGFQDGIEFLSEELGIKFSKEDIDKAIIIRTKQIIEMLKSDEFRGMLLSYIPRKLKTKREEEISGQGYEHGVKTALAYAVRKLNEMKP